VEVALNISGVFPHSRHLHCRTTLTVSRKRVTKRNTSLIWYSRLWEGSLKSSWRFK